MAKKKKTRQQKIVADLKRELVKKTLSSQNDQVVKLDTPKEILPKKEFLAKPVEKKDNATNYNYLIRDLRKTALLTTSIIALQIILFFILTNKILVLPGLSY